MNCFHCEKSAVGICRFCGRGLCREHLSNRPYIMSALPGEGGQVQVLAVEDVLYCGTCCPRDEYVVLPTEAGGD